MGGPRVVLDQEQLDTDQILGGLQQGQTSERYLLTLRQGLDLRLQPVKTLCQLLVQRLQCSLLICQLPGDTCDLPRSRLQILLERGLGSILRHRRRLEATNLCLHCADVGDCCPQIARVAGRGLTKPCDLSFEPCRPFLQVRAYAIDLSLRLIHPLRKLGDRIRVLLYGDDRGAVEPRHAKIERGPDNPTQDEQQHQLQQNLEEGAQCTPKTT